jgi:hypothetical protein
MAGAFCQVPYNRLCWRSSTAMTPVLSSGSFITKYVPTPAAKRKPIHKLDSTLDKSLFSQTEETKTPSRRRSMPLPTGRPPLAAPCHVTWRLTVLEQDIVGDILNVACDDLR